MMLPSTCAPSLIWRSEARTSPLIWPKTCAGPLHSMLPTIDMSEPMQEAVPAFVVGSDLAQAWSCGCTVLPMISAAFAAASLSYSTSPPPSFRRHAVQKGLRLSYRDRARAGAEPLTLIAWQDSQVETPSEHRNAQTIFQRVANRRRWRVTASGPGSACLFSAGL